MTKHSAASAQPIPTAGDSPPSASLTHHRPFMTFWAAQTVSVFGSQVTLLALPLAAVLTLHATAAQMGALTALDTAPYLLFSLFAGVWVDRRRRLPVLVAADLLRVGLLISVPIAALLGALRIEQLYAVAFLAGTGAVFFRVAYSSFIPTLVGRGHLVEANGRLTSSFSLAQVGGPSLAGALVQLLTAPVAIAADAASFVVSAVTNAFILRVQEPAPEPRVVGVSMWCDIHSGLRHVAGDPALRAMAGCTSTLNFFNLAIQAAFILFATRELGFSPGLLGLVLAGGAVGAVLGAVLAGRIGRRFGMGRAVTWGATVTVAGLALLPFAAGPRLVAAAVILASEFIAGFAVTIFDVNQVSLRQLLTPDALLARTGATSLFITWGVRPLGALAGGAIGQAYGLRTAIIFGACGQLLSLLWVWLSPLPSMRAPQAAPPLAAADRRETSACERPAGAGQILSE
ncbi:MAG: MFS transporter [Dehalococcoidia bacterium]